MLSKVVYVLWAGFVFFSILSAIFFAGKGTSLIAGFNTSSKNEQDSFDKRKMTFTLGCGMGFLALCQLFMAIFASKIPFYVFYIFQGVLLATCIVMVILLNTVCKKK